MLQYIGPKIKSIASLGDISQGFNALERKEAKSNRGFTQKEVFKTHVIYVGYQYLFSRG